MSPFASNLFINPLVVPDDNHEPLAPCMRLTNAGWLVVTLEYDPDDLAGFEECFGWFLSNDDKGAMPFDEVDRALCRYREYRGYCSVYSGAKSIHSHLLFDTRHLINAPFQLEHAQRHDEACAIAPVMNAAHGILFDAARQCVEEVLKPSRQPDGRLRSAVQFRRYMYGSRELDKNYDFLGLRKGDRLLQIVIRENIRQIAPRGASVSLLPDDLDAPIPLPSGARAKCREPIAGPLTPMVTDLLREAWKSVWDGYPELAYASVEGGQHVIHFRNSAADEMPSTIVKGDNRCLLACGKDKTSQKIGFPGDMTADQFVEWAIDEASNLDSEASFDSNDRAAITRDERLKISRLTELYLSQPHQDRLFSGPPGCAKTFSLLVSMMKEMTDMAITDAPRKHFVAYAARKAEQAREKMDELGVLLDEKGKRGVLFESLWRVYDRTCNKLKRKKIPKHEFASHCVGAILKHIRERQPEVFDEMEHYRRQVWKEAQFCAGSTVIFTTTAMVRVWHQSHMKAWLHPKFHLDMSYEEEAELATELAMGIVAYDEIEIKEFLTLWQKDYFDEIKSLQEKNRPWRRMTYQERFDVFRDVSGKHLLDDFDQFDADMRTNLRALQPISVDYKFARFRK